jgi:RHS repeat-associated protein
MVLDATYTWDNEGRMTAPNGAPGIDWSAPTHNYQYDAMGRLNGTTWSEPVQFGAYNYSASATYGVAGQMTSFNGDTRTYNNLLQLTRIQSGTALDIEYFYAAGQNNGRITRQLDRITGEDVSYSYDVLNRLSSATATGITPGWSQSYPYDGFGNMGGGYDWATNRLIGGGYDANGNPSSGTYDVENRSLTAAAGGVAGGNASYDQSGKRVWWEDDAPVHTWDTSCEVYFYGITGQKLATYTCGYDYVEDDGRYFWWRLKGRNVYFAGKPVSLNGVNVRTDRLGSVRWNSNGERFNYYPYGAERGTTANGREKFGTYFRDSDGMDYADQRYYSPVTGRFTTPDPYRNSAGVADPSSWNRYSYTRGDPINRLDPFGTEDQDADCTWDTTTNTLNCPSKRNADPSLPKRVFNTVISDIKDLFGINSGMRSNTPQMVAWGIADDIARQVNAGQITDCEGLTAFADSMAGQFSNPADFVEAFGVFVPLSDASVKKANDHGIHVAANTNWVTMLQGMPGAASGFKSVYQESLDKINPDQTHHFAVFFQIGYNAGGDIGAAAAIWHDISPLNTGDIALGIAAATLGDVLHDGILGVNGIVDQIHGLCK